MPKAFEGVEEDGPRSGPTALNANAAATFWPATALSVIVPMPIVFACLNYGRRYLEMAATASVFILLRAYAPRWTTYGLVLHAHALLLHVAWHRHACHLYVHARPHNGGEPPQRDGQLLCDVARLMDG